ncbi:MAG: class I SAM-dependent methyltransferase [Pirellulaceae bacterium]
MGRFSDALPHVGRHFSRTEILGFYSEVILPRFYDILMDTPFLSRRRQEQLAGVSGEVLEIGAGTGLNLPHYPQSVRRIATVDPNRGMHKRLQARIAETGVEVDTWVVSGEQLPFEDASFDFVVSTLTLCSIPDARRAVAELFRVLKPGGQFVFLEHGISPDDRVRRWQHRLNWLQRRFADGCRLDIDVRQLVRSQPFTMVEIDNFYLERVPKSHGYIYRGAATK